MEMINLVGIEYVDSGRSIKFELINTIPPYNVRFLTFKNLVFFRIYLYKGDGFPLVVYDFNWQVIASKKIPDVLAEFTYPFYNRDEGLPTLTETLVFAHLEGEIVCDLLAEEIIDDQPH